MTNNLFVSYDLHTPGQNYEAVAAVIKQLGNWAKVHYSLWYVDSQYSAGQAVEHVWKAMDSNDRLLVVDASHNNAAWQNLEPKVGDYIRQNWS